MLLRSQQHPLMSYIVVLDVRQTHIIKDDITEASKPNFTPTKLVEVSCGQFFSDYLTLAGEDAIHLGRLRRKLFCLLTIKIRHSLWRASNKKFFDGNAPAIQVC